MVEWALQLHEALMLLVGMSQYNKLQGGPLNCFKLLKLEWELLSQLFPLLDLHIMHHDAKYYGLSDESIMYHIAMHKLSNA